MSSGCPSRCEQAFQWLQNYNNAQTITTILLYSQVACGMLGSVGALYSGQLLVGLIVGLFALVAIESGSRTLICTYTVLLPCTLILDIAWLIFYYWETRQYDTGNFGKGSSFSVKVAFWMQISGFALRCVSLLPWFQIYKLGASSSEDASSYEPVDFESRIGLSTSGSRWPFLGRQSSVSTESNRKREYIQIPE